MSVTHSLYRPKQNQRLPPRLSAGKGGSYEGPTSVSADEGPKDCRVLAKLRNSDYGSRPHYSHDIVVFCKALNAASMSNDTKQFNALQSHISRFEKDLVYIEVDDSGEVRKNARMSHLGQIGTCPEGHLATARELLGICMPNQPFPSRLNDIMIHARQYTLH